MKDSDSQDKLPYVVTASVAGNASGSTSALTREGIQLELAMRLVTNGKKVREAWLIAEKFAEEMDEFLPALPPPPEED